MPGASSACRQVLSKRNENQAITLEIHFLFCRPVSVWAVPKPQNGPNKTCEKREEGNHKSKNTNIRL